MREAGSERSGLLCLDRNERVGTFPAGIAAELSARLSDLDPTRYPSADSVYPLLSRWFAVDRERLLLTPGADGALRSLFQAYIEPGDAVVTVRPSYAMYEVYADMAGARVSAVDCGSDLRFDLSEMMALMSDDVRLVVLANPNQPTGAVVEVPRLSGLIETAARIGALVVVDETYAPFADTTVLDFYGDRSNVIVLQSFSKVLGLAGLRVGAVVADSEVIEALATVRSVYDINAAALVALEVLLEHPEAFDQYRREITEGRVRLEEGLRALGLSPFPTAANFIVVRVRPVIEPQVLIDALMYKGILIRGPFDHPSLDGCVRITLGPTSVMNQVVAAIADVLEQS